MPILQRLTDDELKALAERLLAPEMADLGFRGVDIEHRDIFDDGPSLYVGLKVGADVPSPFDSTASPPKRPFRRDAGRGRRAFSPHAHRARRG